MDGPLLLTSEKWSDLSDELREIAVERRLVSGQSGDESPRERRPVTRRHRKGGQVGPTHVIVGCQGAVLALHDLGSSL
jgi:hypothetical protein